MGRFQATSTNPFQNGSVLIARFIAMPALASIVGGQIIADISRTIRRPSWLEQQQAFVRSIDVNNAHRVFVVLLAVLVRENAFGIGRLQLEDHMAGVAEDAGLSVKAGLRKNRLNSCDEVTEVEYRPGLHVA